MPRLGVVTCQILELEFAHVLLNDPDISEIRVVRDEFSEELLRILERKSRTPVHRVMHTDKFEMGGTNGVSVLIRVMKVGLHSIIPELTRAVTAAVREMAPHVDAVLLGYGLCGNALENAADLFKDISVPVTLPMDEVDPVDDCVGLIIGGRENYYAEQCKCAGTMFMNAGFSRHWEEMLSLNVSDKFLHKKDDIMK
ncbi:MAG: DUF1638 domain-containing protein, partial [Desulfobacterales bacterium]|nr:DUF1638 domain-containing protein [Desulfobacterales bacterium]